MLAWVACVGLLGFGLALAHDWNSCQSLDVSGLLEAAKEQFVALLKVAFFPVVSSGLPPGEFSLE